MNNFIRRTWNINSMVNIEDLRGTAFQQEENGHTFCIDAVDASGNSYPLSGTPSGVMLRADGQDVVLNCAVQNGCVIAVLPADCYAVPGRFGLTIFLTSDGQTTAIYAAVGAVTRTSSGIVAPPVGDNVTTLVNQITAALANFPIQDTTLKAAIAPVYSTSAVYAVGSYAWYDGVLYRCTTAITSGETWTSGHWTTAAIGNDVYDLKSAIVKENVAQVDDKTRTTTGIFIDATTTKWKTSSTATYAIIKVKSGDKVKLVAGSRATYIAILKSYSAPVADTDPDYSDATGFTTLINVTSNSTYSNEMPSDANYFYVFLGTSSTVRTPAVLEINGYDYVQPLFDNYSKIINQINTHFSELDSTYKVSSAAASEYSNLLSHIINVGVYYISNTQPFTDRPQYIRTSDLGMTITVSEYATTLVKQELITARGLVATRLVNKSNFTPYTTAMGVDGNGWFYAQSMRWTNKKIVCFGDSRTWYDGQTYNSRTKPGISGITCIGYQEQMRILLGAILTNEGVSGDKSTQICDRIRSYDFSEFDAVLLEGGVNDYIKSSSVTIGELQPIGSTFDTTTVYGAWQSAIEYLMTNYPKVKIFITVPAIAWDDDNTMGTVFPYTVASIKKEIAELYMLPVLDLYTTAGITVINRDTFYCDDVSQTGWRLHFNNDGNVLIGQMIAEYIETH